MPVESTSPTSTTQDAPEIVVRTGGFQWPPAPPGSITPPAVVQTPEKQSRFRVLVDSIETTLLGRTALSFAKQAERDGWHADDPSVYCWRCAGSVGMHETDGDGCASCKNTRLHWDQAIRLGKFDGLIRDAVLDLKFHRWRKTGSEIGTALGESVADRMEQAQIRPREVLVVPIAMSERRRIRRGIDHTRVLARAVSQTIGCPMGRILRAKHRPEQIGLSMTARSRNIKGAFRVRKGGMERIGEDRRVVVLVDDVRTTGATMTAAIKGIKVEIREMKKQKKPVPKVEFWVATAGVAGRKARDQQILKN